MKADLHLHSVYSDGLYKPSEIIKLAIKRRLDLVSLTDHDSVEGCKLFLAAAGKSRIMAIPGVELSSYLDGKEIHVLGYRFDYRDKALNKKLKEFREKRKTRILLMIDKLNGLGAKIVWKDITRVAKKGLFGRMHIALALVSNRSAKSIQEVFYRYIGNGKPAYIPKEYFAPLDAIKLIKSAGGISVIAHPASSNLNEKDIGSLISLGLDGIEVFHPKHKQSKINELKNICKKAKIIMTGGSDFHGVDRNEFDNFGSKYATLTADSPLIYTPPPLTGGVRGG